MYCKQIYILIIVITILHSVVDAKKSKKNKRPLYENEESTPQPNVIAYSTFGFNDVGSYDGFVPSSPDYSNYINDVHQESSTRLYAPAFPTALESNGYNYKYDENDGQQSSVLQYPQKFKHLLNSLNQENDNINSANQHSSGKNKNNVISPEYGAKLNFINKNKSNQFNSTDFNTLYNSGYYSSSNDNKYFNLPEDQTTHDTNQNYGESDLKYQNDQTNIVTYPTTGIESFTEQVAENKPNFLNFPRVVDFTKMMQIHYPSAIENVLSTTFSPIQNENSYSHSYSENSEKKLKQLPFSVDSFNYSDTNLEPTKKKFQKQNSYDGSGISYSYSTSHNKNIATESTGNTQYDKKPKYKQWILNKNHTNSIKTWKDAPYLKRFEQFSKKFNKSFSYEPGAIKKPTTTDFDEVVPESSNLIDFAKYQFSDADYTNFKKMPELPYESNYNSLTSSKINDYVNPYKHLTDTTPTGTSYWGNGFTSSDNSPFKIPLKKLPFYNDEQNDDEVVSITKRPNRYTSIYRPTEINPTDWLYASHSPYKSSKPPKDLSKEFYNRYKSEEDLLSIRNHDTSHSSYLPIQNPYETSVSDNDYKNIVDKWKQSYLKAKYKNSLLRDYEAFGTEAESVHVPIPKPYSIEIPHPVIVPVPQPYPVRIPIAKPVAVPVIQELTIPIEKPVPYPVYKKVPYPIEKLVPVPVEKEVAVPVVKPYPVHIPYIRPVFHHTKSVYDESDNIDDDDYFPRPENSQRNVHYKRRPFSSNPRIRRPNRNSHQDRNRRLMLNRRRPSASHPTVNYRYKKPYGEEFQVVPNKYDGRDTERLKDDHSSYILYCKRRGIC